jgi:hypothetical protein
MPLWLYQLPNWQLGTLITGGLIALGLGGHAIFQKRCRTIFPESDRNLAIALMAVVATVNSLLLAFSAISVWDAFSAADRAVSGEATTIGELSRDLSAFDTAQSLQAGVRLSAYARAVVDDEWSAMQMDQASPSTWADFDLMFNAVARIEPATLRETALMPEIWARANELVKYRRARLDASKGRVPGTLWAVVVVGTLLTIMPSFVLPARLFNRTGIAMLSLSMGLVLFFIAALDRPFVGKESISDEPFQLYLHSAANPSTATLASTSDAPR